MATVDLTTKFLPKVDEQFTAESKRSLVTNQDFTWDGAATVRVYKVSTGKMNDYDWFEDIATGRATLDKPTTPDRPPERPAEPAQWPERNHNLI